MGGTGPYVEPPLKHRETTDIMISIRKTQNNENQEDRRMEKTYRRHSTSEKSLLPRKSNIA